MVTFRGALTQGTQLLTDAGIQGARKEAQVLLGAVVEMDKAHLIAYAERELTPEQEHLYTAWLDRRKQHEPVAYILGHEEFYGLDFLVDCRVLIPRPETELLVETALGHIRSWLSAGKTPVVADIGTGSGAIPITIAVEEPRLPLIYACDISPDALDVARLNIARHHVGERIQTLAGDLISPLPEPVDLLLANLPYVGTTEVDVMEADVLDFEPHLALFSGPQGLDVLQRFCEAVQHSAVLKSGGVMLLEIGYQQGAPLVQLLQKLWPQALVTCQKDFAGWDRLVQVQLG
ncbi:MAG TPA: peptide chain release factor N(5)-glutamine methyltransferase [Dictyobacter sp.]|jgi:release factor glutamine methyltransferase|nr:peptide chain release factor N(5)-glutamine methyltransferase [Dictyobacter sp.]